MRKTNAYHKQVFPLFFPFHIINFWERATIEHNRTVYAFQSLVEEIVEEDFV